MNQQNLSDSPNSDATEKAEMNHKFFLKFLAIGIVCLALMGWFLYDGMIGYPKRLIPSEAYYSNKSFVDEPASWREFALEKGWDPAVPEKAEKIQNDISGQYFFAGLCLVAAVPFLLKYLFALGSFIEATPKEIRPSWKKKPISIDQITKIDKTKWIDKGVAKVFYGNGQKFVMDDFKFDRKPMARIMYWAEANLTADQIVGGVRQKDPDETEASTADTESNKDKVQDAELKA